MYKISFCVFNTQTYSYIYSLAHSCLYLDTYNIYIYIYIYIYVYSIFLVIY